MQKRAKEIEGQLLLEDIKKMIEEKKEEFELRTVNTDQKEGTEEGNKSQDPKSKT